MNKHKWYSAAIACWVIGVILVSLGIGVAVYQHEAGSLLTPFMHGVCAFAEGITFIGGAVSIVVGYISFDHGFWSVE